MQAVRGGQIHDQRAQPNQDRIIESSRNAGRARRHRPRRQHALRATTQGKGRDGRNRRARGGAAARGPQAHRQLETVGSLPGRPAMGDGPRGLLGGRLLLDVLPARPCPQPRVSLGRGRSAGDHRPRVPAVFRAGLVERQGPDPQGAAVRPVQSRGQPRRGRQGVLLPHRQHADALLHEGPLQVPSGGLPLRPAAAGERPAGPGSAGVRDHRHGDLRREPLLQRLRRVRQGRAQRHPHPDHRRQPRPGDRAASPAADPVVPQHLVERVHARGLLAPAVDPADQRNGPAGRSPDPREVLPRGRAAGRPGPADAVYAERNEQPAALRHAQRQPLRQGLLPPARHRR